MLGILFFSFFISYTKPLQISKRSKLVTWSPWLPWFQSLRRVLFMLQLSEYWCFEISLGRCWRRRLKWEIIIQGKKKITWYSTRSCIEISLGESGMMDLHSGYRRLVPLMVLPLTLYLLVLLLSQSHKSCFSCSAEASAAWDLTITWIPPIAGSQEIIFSHWKQSKKSIHHSTL